MQRLGQIGKLVHFARSISVLQQWTLRLLLGAVALPILMSLMFGVGALLSALDDVDGAIAIRRINLGISVLWVFDLLMLLVVLALSSLLTIEKHADSHDPNDAE